VRDYVIEYLEEIDSYRAAPNRRAYFPHVIKALAADLSGHLDSVIFISAAARSMGLTEMRIITPKECSEFTRERLD
jgi:hypothetical protein